MADAASPAAAPLLLTSCFHTAAATYVTKQLALPHWSVKSTCLPHYPPKLLLAPRLTVRPLTPSRCSAGDTALRHQQLSQLIAPPRLQHPQHLPPRQLRLQQVRAVARVGERGERSIGEAEGNAGPYEGGQQLPLSRGQGTPSGQVAGLQVVPERQRQLLSARMLIGRDWCDMVVRKACSVVRCRCGVVRYRMVTCGAVRCSEMP